MNNLNKPYKSIIFDMDGTLIDAVDLYLMAWNKYFQINQISKKFDKNHFNSLMGMDEKTFLLNVLPEIDEKKRKEIFEKVMLIQDDLMLEKGGNLYPFVIEGIKILKEKYDLFIVSNCAKDGIKVFLKKYNLTNYFKDSISHGETYKQKDENILLLKEKYNLNLEEIIYVGDTLKDEISSNKANVDYAFVSYGFGSSNNPKFIFNSFKELVDFFKN